MIANQNSDDDRARDIAKIAGNKGLVLSVETRVWQTIYLLDLTHYQLRYWARLRVADGATGALLSEVPCEYSSGDDQPQVTNDELFADQGALLKKKIAAAVDFCTGTFEQGLFAPPPPPALAPTP